VEAEEAPTQEDMGQTEQEDEVPIYNAQFLPSIIPLSITPGQTDAHVIVFAKNTGNTIWKKSDTSLNVVGGSSVNTQFYHSTWITKLRPSAMIEQQVPPGEIASFAFTVTVPSALDQTFRLQLVHQESVTFSQVGVSFVNIIFVQKNVEPMAPIDTQPEYQDVDQDEQTVLKQLENIKDVLGEKIGDVFENISKALPNIFSFGSGSSEIEEDVEDEEIEEEEDEIIEQPEITITSPTSTFVTTTSATTTIFGELNETVSSMTVNGLSTEALVLNTASGTWHYDAVLTESVTTSFSFVGWNASTTASSSVVSVSFLYTSAEPDEPDAPEITIVFPTSSPYMSTSTPIVVLGTFNTTTAYLTLDGATSTAFVMNTSTNEWEYSISDIAEYVTTTYTFIAWSEDGVSSTPVSRDIIYAPEEDLIEPADAPNILFPTEEDSYTTSTIAFDIAGSAPTGTVSVVLDLLSATSTVDVVEGQWNVPVRFPGIGTYELTVYGVDESGALSASSTLSVTLERSLDNKDYGIMAFSEIAWMGTEASANDEWFEIMVLPPETQQTSDDVGEEIPLRIVWGAYDSDMDRYEHSKELTEAVLDAWSQGGGQAILEPGPAIYLPLHFAFLFERTDQSTLPNANGIVYTGALSNDGERMLILADGVVILDEIDASLGWPAGDNDTKEVMLRTDLFENAWCTYSSCPESEYIGEQVITDADGNLIKGSPYSPFLLLIPEL
ncbi:MAG: hypothetical protein COV60_01855, partial [Candidatus Magasanikbacteria bacterium CG11_big_fil_rev_8_21_14_0_20_43_7]